MVAKSYQFAKQHQPKQGQSLAAASSKMYQSSNQMQQHPINLVDGQNRKVMKTMEVGQDDDVLQY